MEIPIALLVLTTRHRQAGPSMNRMRVTSSWVILFHQKATTNRKFTTPKLLQFDYKATKNILSTKTAKLLQLMMALSITQSFPIDTTKLQLLLNEQSLIRDKTSFSNAGLQILKVPPQHKTAPYPIFLQV